MEPVTIETERLVLPDSYHRARFRLGAGRWLGVLPCWVCT